MWNSITVRICRPIKFVTQPNSLLTFMCSPSGFVSCSQLMGDMVILTETISLFRPRSRLGDGQRYFREGWGEDLWEVLLYLSPQLPTHSDQASDSSVGLG